MALYVNCFLLVSKEKGTDVSDGNLLKEMIIRRYIYRRRYAETRNLRTLTAEVKFLRKHGFKQVKVNISCLYTSLPCCTGCSFSSCH